MIRLAGLADAPMIVAYLRAVPNPPLTNEEQIAGLLVEPDRIVMVDTVTLCVAGIAFSNTRRSPTRENAPLGVVDIPWLLPRASWTLDNVDDIARVLLAALRELVKRIPEAVEWPCGGEFEGDQVDDPVGRIEKSRELGRFWEHRYALTIEVRDWHGLARSEAATVAHLIRQFTAYFRNG